jgi:hypothetical protein
MDLDDDRRHWDGTEALPFVYDDGGRSAAGFKGRAGDCVTRSIVIASGLPYGDVYARLAKETGTQRVTRGKRRSASARNGINTSRKWFKDYMASLGFTWTPTMKIGEGCKVHLLKGELPNAGSLIVAVSRHYTAIVNGVIHDTHDPTRAMLWTENGVTRMSHRCVYGFWTKEQ